MRIHFRVSRKHNLKDNRGAYLKEENAENYAEI